MSFGWEHGAWETKHVKDAGMTSLYSSIHVLPIAPEKLKSEVPRFSSDPNNSNRLIQHKGCMAPLLQVKYIIIRWVNFQCDFNRAAQWWNIIALRMMIVSSA